MTDKVKKLFDMDIRGWLYLFTLLIIGVGFFLSLRNGLLEVKNSYASINPIVRENSNKLIETKNEINIESMKRKNLSMQLDEFRKNQDKVNIKILDKLEKITDSMHKIELKQASSVITFREDNRDG